MHGRGGEERKRALQHMWTDPTPTISAVAADVSLLSSPLPNSFYKDRRKICIGDCALFKPSEESPPFVGIIRCVTTSNDNNLTLGVNWFYRPAEITLGKGILLEAAPNEIFYSFHEDETSAASLLHLCKVSFLPKGVELPSGISSFVCRRVYDITDNCLWWLTDQDYTDVSYRIFSCRWWLTDQDYTDEHQEEVNRLLSKTHIEMHGTVQSGGHSPKPVNGPTATSQSKPGSDSVQNSGSSFPSQVKGKKRERGERGDPGLEPIKRERSVKLDDVDSANSRVEGTWKSEVVKLKEKGGLVDFSAVEKLVQFMLYDRNEKNTDLVGRSIMAGVVAATDKFDCLDRFVQLRGLPVFDEWIHEVHKGRTGDGNGFKDSDKPAEEFLLVILRALDKLPVDLHALQTCNIGKSVNHLRTHRNLEIQKKAKGLVDTWKRRVEAEMDAKSGSNQGVSWATRSRIPDASHVGSRHTGIATEVTLKSCTNHLSAVKPAPVKLVHGETMTKSASGSPGSNKSTLVPVPVPGGTAVKEGQARYVVGASGSIASPTMVRDEKSSSSSQSHSNSQAVSGDQNRTVGFSGKEDTRSSGSVRPNRAAKSSSRHRNSSNGFLGQGGSAVQRETGSSRSSPMQRNPGAEKLSQISYCEKVVDFPTVNSQKLVVKIPNRGHSPSQSACEGSFDGPSSVHNRSCSPLPSEKQDQLDRNLKNVVCHANIVSDVKTESWQSNDFKDVLNGSDEGDGSPVTGLDDAHSRAGEDTKNLAEVPKSTSLPSSSEKKLGKLPDASFSSINALIESCAKCSDGNASTSTADDVGMNLLATVATGDISTPDLVSPASLKMRTPVCKQCNAHIGSRLLAIPGDNVAHECGQSAQNIAGEPDNNGGHVGKLDVEADGSSQDKVPAEHSHGPNSSLLETEQSKEQGKIKEDKTLGIPSGSFVGLPVVDGLEKKSGNVGNYPWKVEASNTLTVEAISDAKEKPVTFFSIGHKDNVGGVEVGAGGVQGFSPHSASYVEVENKKMSDKDLNPVSSADQKPPAVLHSNKGKTATQMLNPSDAGQEMVSKCHKEVQNEEADGTIGRNPQPENPKTDQLSNSSSTDTSQKAEHEEQILCTGANEQKSASHDESRMQLDQRVGCRGSHVKRDETDQMEETCPAIGDASVAVSGSQVNGVKAVFDLNEGLNGDDGKYTEPRNVKFPSSGSIQLINPLPLQASSLSSSLPALITVAAAAKGPFVPPEDLLKNKGEIGWRGSAATSAFRPAEPRKAVDVNAIATSSPFPIPSSKPTRPFLDFDLNVADERVLEDLASRGSDQDMTCVPDIADRENDEVRSCGGLDLDLNKMDDDADIGNHLTMNGQHLDSKFESVKPSSAGLLNNVGVRCDFDLNNGPLAEEVSVEASSFVQQSRNIIVSQTSVPAFRVSNKDLGNFSSWLPQGNFPGVAFQSVLPVRGEHPFSLVAPGASQRMIAPASVSNAFSPDAYRGPVLSSSPAAIPFPSAPFQYPVFPFGNNFPLSSAAFSGGSTTFVDSTSGGRLCFPAMQSQVLTPAGTVPSSYPRPYAVNVPDTNSIGSESSRKWGRQGLDLNAGPLGPDREGRDETASLASRQLSLANSQVFVDEQQSRMYQVSGGGVLKRKEPDGGGWEGFKNSSWQ